MRKAPRRATLARSVALPRRAALLFAPAHGALARCLSLGRAALEAGALRGEHLRTTLGALPVSGQERRAAAARRPRAATLAGIAGRELRLGFEEHHDAADDLDPK